MIKEPFKTAFILAGMLVAYFWSCHSSLLGNRVANNVPAGGGGPDNTLILRYKFDEGSGTAVADETANNNDATLSGATWITGKSGSGEALQFDGSNDTLSTDASVTYGTNVITTCAWLYNTWPGGSGIQNIYESSANGKGGSNSGVFAFDCEFATLSLYTQGDAFGHRREDDTPDPADSTWIHVAVVHDNSTASGDIKLFLNGVEQSLSVAINSDAGTQNYSARTLFIGSRNNSSAFYGGRIDDFRIYAGELTTTEIEYVRDNPDE